LNGVSAGEFCLCFERKKEAILEVPSWRREMPAGCTTSTQAAGLVVPSSELSETIRRGEERGERES
jgi:hypothetical protein